MVMDENGTWPIAKPWPDTAYAEMNGRWFRLAHIGEGRYVVVDGPFGTHHRAMLAAQTEASERPASAPDAD